MLGLSGFHGTNFFGLLKNGVAPPCAFTSCPRICTATTSPTPAYCTGTYASAMFFFKNGAGDPLVISPIFSPATVYTGYPSRPLPRPRPPNLVPIQRHRRPQPQRIARAQAARQYSELRARIQHLAPHP